MPTEVFQCCTCGAPLSFSEGVTSVVCEYCGVTNNKQERLNQQELVAQLEQKAAETAATAAKQAMGEQLTAAKNAAVEQFLKGDLKSAEQSADTVLREASDCVEAELIKAFCSYHAQQQDESRMRGFLNRLTDRVLADEEREHVRSMLLKFPSSFSAYEAEVIRCIQKHDPQNLCSFVDAFSPYIIKKRDSTVFLTSELVGLYCELARQCDIPKTCYALLGSITTIPGSPYANDSFYLKTRTMGFRDQYLLPIGRIIESIKSEQLRTQFVGAYRKRLADFDARMK